MLVPPMIEIYILQLIAHKFDPVAQDAEVLTCYRQYHGQCDCTNMQCQVAWGFSTDMTTKKTSEVPFVNIEASLTSCSLSYCVVLVIRLPILPLVSWRLNSFIP